MGQLRWSQIDVCDLGNVILKNLYKVFWFQENDTLLVVSFRTGNSG